MKITATLCMLAGMALIPSSLVVAQTDAPRVERPVWPPPGSTWIVQNRSTGSLGSGSSIATWQALGEQVRIRRDGPDDRYIVWFNPELAVEVKRVWERFSSHRLGPGKNEMELLSHSIKK